MYFFYKYDINNVFYIDIYCLRFMYVVYCNLYWNRWIFFYIFELHFVFFCSGTEGYSIHRELNPFVVDFSENTKSEHIHHFCEFYFRSFNPAPYSGRSNQKFRKGFIFTLILLNYGLLVRGLNNLYKNLLQHIGIVEC